MRSRRTPSTPLSRRINGSPAAAVFGTLLATGVCLGLYLWATQNGVGPIGDSYEYVSAARNALAGRGFVVGGYGLEEKLEPITQFPPGTSATLAATAWATGLDVSRAAHVVNAASLAIVLIGAGWLTWRGCRSAVAATGAPLAVGGSLDFPFHFARLGSEPPFAALVVVFFAVIFAGRRRVWAWPLAAILAAAATLVRYAGVWLLPVGALAPLLHHRRPWRWRIAASGLFLLVYLGPPIALAAWNFAAEGEVAGRQLQAEWPTWNFYYRAYDTAAFYLLPKNDEVLTYAVLIGFVLAIGPLPLGWRLTGHRARGIEWALWLAVASYLPTLWIAAAVQDPNVRPHGRLLCVAWPPTVALVAIQLGRLPWRRFAGKPAGVALAIALGVFVAAHLSFNLIHRVKAAASHAERGYGYSTPLFNDSPTLAAVRALPPSVPLLTNAADFVYFKTGRRAAQVPIVRWPRSDKPNVNRFAQIRETGDWARERDPRIVFFDIIDRDGYLVSEETLLQKLELELVTELPDGRIYRVAGGD